MVILNVHRQVTYSAFIIQNLDLSRVAQFDHSSHRDVKLSARFKVQPHIVPLYNNTQLSLEYSINLHLNLQYLLIFLASMLKIEQIYKTVFLLLW